MTRRLFLSRPGLICAAGQCYAKVVEKLFAAERPAVLTPFVLTDKQQFPSGVVRASLADTDFLPVTMRSRNNALLLTAVHSLQDRIDALKARYGARRIGIVLGKSTSGIAESAQALAYYKRHNRFPENYDYTQQEMGNAPQMLAHVLGIQGPCYAISTACSSSARALASAARLINMGLCDAVITGGVDALGPFTIAGFHALGALSNEPCLPFSVNRHGINIGEGAAVFILSHEEDAVSLAGWGESADAYHISAPDPEGCGAIRAIEAALKMADITVQALDYVNLHGTATAHNDAMESKTMLQIGAEHLPVSSTKPLTGHTLAAAGAVEAALCYAVLAQDNQEGWLPVHHWDGMPDPQLPRLHFVQAGEQLGRQPRYVLSNSFGFGGSNACLVMRAE